MKEHQLHDLAAERLGVIEHPAAEVQVVMPARPASVDDGVVVIELPHGRVGASTSSEAEESLPQAPVVDWSALLILLGALVLAVVLMLVIQGRG